MQRADSRLISDSTPIQKLLQRDSLHFVREIEHALRAVTGRNISLQYKFHHSSLNTESACTPHSQCDQLLFAESSLYQKRLSRLILDYVSLFRNASEVLFETKTLGYSPAWESFVCLKQNQASDEVGGGSGAGLQVFCSNSIVLSAGGGGGGGVSYNSKTPVSVSFGGGGGFGVQFYDNGTETFSSGGGGGGGGGDGEDQNMNHPLYSTSYDYNEGSQSYHYTLDRTAYTTGGLKASLHRVFNEIKTCMEDGTLKVVGGGGGGAGRSLSPKLSCGYGYGISFSYNVQSSQHTSIKSNFDGSDEDGSKVNNIFQNAVLSCDGYSNWTCMCTKLRDQYMINSSQPPVWIQSLNCTQQRFTRSEMKGTLMEEEDMLMFTIQRPVDYIHRAPSHSFNSLAACIFLLFMVIILITIKHTSKKRRKYIRIT